MQCLLWNSVSDSKSGTQIAGLSPYSWFKAGSFHFGSHIAVGSFSPLTLRGLVCLRSWCNFKTKP